MKYLLALLILSSCSGSKRYVYRVDYFEKGGKWWTLSSYPFSDITLEKCLELRKEAESFLTRGKKTVYLDNEFCGEEK